jgi:hypothetical protein
VTSTAWQLVPLTPASAAIAEWTANGFGTGLQYRNTGDQTCLQGLLSVTAAAPTGSFATLPSGSLPTQSLAFPVATSSGAAASVFIDYTGTINFVMPSSVTGGNGDWVSFNGICFETFAP